jgi:aminodeoxychorismate lyase
MNEAGFLIHDGKMRKSGIPLVSPDNRSFRYGDGFFETMQLVNGKIILEELHFERLFTSLDILRFKRPSYFTPAYLREHITALAEKNKHTAHARIRLTIFRGEGGLYEVEDHSPHHIIQTWPLNPSIHQLNENGMVVGIYKEARKTCDGFSHVKSNNYLSYAMAALWAKEQKLNDALLLNPFNRIADATIANVFIVKDGLVKTPALSEGCVSGVMRRYLLQTIRKENIPVEETQLEIEDVMQASEIFLTNAIHGIRWVKQVGESEYANQLTSLLHKNMVQALIG